MEHVSGKKTTEMLSALEFMVSVIADSSDIEQILHKVADSLPGLLNADACMVHLAGDDSSWRLSASSGLTENDMARYECVVPGEGLLGAALASGSRDITQGSEHDGLGMLASVPLVDNDNVAGMLTLSWADTPGTSLELKTLLIAGRQLNVAMDNNRLLTRLHSGMEQIKLTNALCSTLSSSLSLGSIFRIMVSEIKKVVSYDRASLLLYDEKKHKLHIFALDTDIKTVMPKGVMAPVEGTSAGWAITNNTPIINYDLHKELKFPLDRKLMEDGIRSSISLPLYQDKLLGAFNLDSKSPGNYQEEHLNLLVPVAKQISMVLENALLFEEVSREKKEWEKTFDAITDMVWIEGPDQRVIRANQAMLKKAGLSVAQLRRMYCQELMDKIGLPPHSSLYEQTPAGKHTNFSEITDASGGMYQFWAYPLKNEDGKPYAIVHYLKDVTAQKRIEQQLVRNDKLASLGILGAGIAHEINNPLGIIAGYAEALMNRAEDANLLKMDEFEDFPEYLETIHNEIFRCKEILNSLLEFAMPHTGKTRKLDINELIKEVMLLVNHRAKSLSYDLVLDLSRDLPALFADPGSLRQLFMNIIINAIYFTPEGGKIQVSTSLCEPSGLSPKSKGNAGPVICVEVTDSGTGIPKHEQEKIFNPFYTTKPTGDGTGLGLSICHKIAEDYGGYIEVKSEAGEGTTFLIMLPSRAFY